MFPVVVLLGGLVVLVYFGTRKGPGDPSARVEDGDADESPGSRPFVTGSGGGLSSSAPGGVYVEPMAVSTTPAGSVGSGVYGGSKPPPTMEPATSNMPRGSDSIASVRQATELRLPTLLNPYAAPTIPVKLPRGSPLTETKPAGVPTITPTKPRI